MGLMPTTNASLMLRLKSSADERSWRQFLDAYQPALLSWLRGRGLQSSDAEDCVQHVLLAVMKSVHQFEDDGRGASFRRWLQTIARHELINTVRQQSRQPRSNRDSQIWLQIADATADENTFIQSIELEFQKEVFLQAAAVVRKSVHDSTWEAFWRTSVLGETAPMVAESLGLKLGAIYMAKGRVLQRIRKIIAEQENLS